MKKVSFAIIALLILSISACKKKDTSTPTTSTGAPAITSTYYFQANIDGTWVTFQENGSSWFSGTYSSEYSLGDTIKGHLEGGEVTDISYANAGGVGGVLTNMAWWDADSAFYYNLFSTGAKSFGKYGISVPGIYTNGFVVSYMVSGEEYRSDYGAATQTGSAFNVTERSILNDGFAYLITGATFNCKLYHKTNGTSKTLTNGKFRGRMVKF